MLRILFMTAMMLLGYCAQLIAQLHKVLPLDHYGIPDSNLVSLVKAMKNIGDKGTFIPDELLFVAAGTTVNKKGRMFNLIVENPYLNQYVVLDGDKKIKLKASFDVNHDLTLTTIVHNHEGSALIGGSHKGAVIVWMKKRYKSDKPKDHIFEIKSRYQLIDTAVREIKISDDDEYLSVLGEKAKRLSIWHQSFAEKPALFHHYVKVNSIDFIPNHPGDFVMGDSAGYVNVLGPRYPNNYTQELFIKDSFSIVPKSPIYKLYYTPSGSYLIIITKDNSIHIYDTKTESAYVPYATFKKAHRALITDLTFLREPNYFITTSHDSTFKLWSIEMSQPLFTKKEKFKITNITASNKENYFIVFGDNNYAHQYYFNDYFLNSLFILYNVQKDIQLAFRRWLKDRDAQPIEQFMKLSSKWHLSNMIKKIFIQGVNDYSKMAFYKNMVTFKPKEYDNVQEQFLCAADGFGGDFKLKIAPKDTNFFKAYYKENLTLSQVQASLASDGGIVLKKGRLMVKDKSFYITSHKDALQLLEDTLKLVFNVDSLVNFYVSSSLNVMMDSVDIDPTLFKSDIDIVSIDTLGKAIAKKQKAVFLNIGISNYKHVSMKHPFGVADANTVGQYFKTMFNFNQPNVLTYKNINASKLYNLLSSPKGELYNLIRKTQAKELYIYISALSTYDRQTHKDYLLPSDVTLSTITSKGLAWSSIIHYLSSLPVLKINLILETNTKTDAPFQALPNPKLAILKPLSQQKSSMIYAKNKFHSLWTYHFIQALRKKDEADKNHNKTLTALEISNYMNKVLHATTSARWSPTIFMSKDPNRAFFLHKPYEPAKKPEAKLKR